MSDNIDIPIEASGEDGVNRLISALDRLHESMGKLGNTSALDRLASSMETMQATMVTGFANLAALAGQSEVERERIAGEGAEKRLRAQLAWEAKQHAAANKFHDKQIELDAAGENARAAALQALIEKRDMETHTRLAREAQEYARFWEKLIASQDAAVAAQVALEQRRDTELHAMRTKEQNDYIAFWEKSVATQVEIEQRRDVELHNMRQRDFADYTAWWDKMLAEQAAKQAKQVEMERMQQVELATIRATAAEKSRNLNTNFITSPLSSQIAMAEKAQVYSSLGGDAASKFGTAATTADLAALRAQHKLLEEAARGSRNAISGHNDVMNEAHSLARGLAGSLGGLWLTYGSLVPLAAGAALAASLKGVVTAGKDVEYQLKFVEALGGGQVSLDQMLHITDATVVSVKEAAEGMRALAQNGLSAQESLKVLPSILNLAVIGEMSVANAALSATGTVSAFGLSLSDLDRVSNIFAQAAATSNTSVTAMTESMKQASTVAGIYGGTVEETAAGLGVLAKVNIIGSAAGTAYTNMLTNLYTPTHKAQEALKELHVEAANGNGQLKNSTQLLSELRNALSGYNASAQANFLGDIFTVRGQKGVSTILQNWDEYIKKTEEAHNVTNFMGEAVAKLEDSTEGALKRLGNNMSSSFNKAFVDSSPVLQHMIMQFSELARGQGAVEALTGIADAVLRVTTTIVEHGKAIGIAVAAYAGFRILSALPAAFAAAEKAVMGLTLSMRSLTAAMGWIGLAVAAVTVAYELFVDKTTDVEKADQRRQNSISVNIEYLDREIERLQERNKLWNPETLQFDKKPTSTTETSIKAEQRVLREREQALALVNERLANARSGDNGIMAASSQQVQLMQQVEASKRRLWELTAKQEELDVNYSIDQQRRNMETTVKAIDGFVKQGEAYDKLSLNFAGKDNAAYLQKTQQAKSIKDQLIANQITAAEATDGLSKLKAEASGLLESRASKPNKHQQNDALNAEMRALQNQLDVKHQIAQAEMTIAQRANKRGELGDLELINTELNSKLEVDKLALGIAQKQYDLASAAAKLAKGATYQGAITKAKTQLTLDKDDAEDRRRSVLERMRQDELQFDAQTLADKGQLVNSYLVEYEAKYGSVIDKVTRDLWATDDTAQVAALVSYLQFLDKLKEAGKNAAVGKEIVNGFALEIDKLHLQIQTLTENSGEGAGLGAIFDNAARAEQAYAAALPGLIEQQKQLQALANETGSTKDQKSALDAAKAVSAEALKMRSVWVDLAKTIGTGLEQAFGRGGKALGGLGVAMAVYDTRRKQIQENYEKSAQTPADLAKKQLDSQSAQIDNYATMAGAAKGFFSENSSGYRLMEGMEKGFRILQLAGQMQSLYTHLFVTTTKATATVSGQAVETGAVVAGEAARNTAKIPGVFMSFMSALGPYGAAAAAVAIAAVLGGAFSGGGGVDTAKNRQAANGTGTVLGDPKAKSDSISKSLAEIEKNTYQGLSVSIGMLDALRSIQSGIGGMGALMARNGVVGTEMAPNQLGGAANLFGATSHSLASGNFYGIIADKLTGGWFSKQAGQIANKIFGGNVSSLDTGVLSNRSSLGSAARGGLQLSQFNDTKTDGGWFRSDKYNTETASLGSESNSQVAKVMSGLRSGIIAAADALGQGGDAFIAQLDKIPVEIEKISTKGMTNEEVETALNNAFSKMGDQLASQAVGGMQQYALAGEGALETLMRVASDFQTVTVVFQSFGKVGNMSIAARERLIELSGGLSEFSSQAESFLKDFYTSAEQASSLRNRIAPTLAQYGLSSAGDEASAKMFRNFIVGLDTSTEAGAQAYAALMKIEPAFKSIVDATKDVTDAAKDIQDQIDEILMTRVQLLEKERDALDPVNRALFDQLQLAKQVTTARDALNDAYEDESEKIKTNTDRIKALGESWQKFRDGLLLGDASPRTPQEKYEESRAQFDKTLAAARGGDTTAQAGYEAAANAFLEASRVANASGAQYSNDFTKVLDATDESVKWASQQVDVGKSSLQALQDSVANLIDIKSAVLSVHDAIAQLAEATRLASIAPNLTPTVTMPEPTSVFYTAENDVARNNASGMTEDQAAQMVGEVAGLRKDQAQQATDQLNATVRAAVEAAKEMAEGMIEAERTRNYKIRLNTEEELA